MAAKVILLILVSLAPLARSQTLTLDVASIKPATPLGPLGMRADRQGGPGTRDPGMYVCRNCPLYWVVSEAYDLQPFEFTGPDWLQSTRFDFLGRVPAGTTKEAFCTMLQNLLADRFKLTVHREKKEMTVYELTVAKGGTKLRPAVAKGAAEEGGTPGPLQRDADGFPILPKGVSMALMPGHGRIRSDHQPLAWFARMLAGQLQSPVIDATELKGVYDFVLSWSFEENSGPVAAAAGELPPAPLLEPFRPALINAVRSQMGLRLEQKRGLAEVLVVDHMERAPSDN